MLVKVIDRILYKLDDLVRPYVHKILVVIEPLLIDEDYYARVEGREIISNLAKVRYGNHHPNRGAVRQIGKCQDSIFRLILN